MLLFIDIDRFKDINDRLGHSAGDEVLRQVASRLSACLREVDAIARQGGDEFIVLLDAIEKPEQVTQVTTRMQEELAKPMTVEGRERQRDDQHRRRDLSARRWRRVDADPDGRSRDVSEQAARTQ